MQLLRLRLHHNSVEQFIVNIMKRFKGLLAIFFVLSLACGGFSSCSDDDDGLLNEKLLPSKIKSSNGESVVRFTYDEQNRLIKVNTTEIFDGEQTSELKIYYDELNKINQAVKTSSYGDGEEDIIRFSYEGANKISYTYKDKENVLLAEGRGVIDSKGNLVWYEKKTYGIYASSAVYDYEYDNDGNVIRTVVDEKYAEAHKYDNKNGIFRYVNTPQWFYSMPAFTEMVSIIDPSHYSMNNLIMSDLVTAKSYKYQYNMHGYLSNVPLIGFELMNGTKVGLPQPLNTADIEYIQSHPVNKE